MLPDTEDTARLAWLNEHGRVSMGDQCFVVAFNHGGGDIGNKTLPTPYNIRHLLDLCRETKRSANGGPLTPESKPNANPPFAEPT